MNDWTGCEAPAVSEIEAIARKAIANLPVAFAGPAADVAIRVAEFADEDMLDELQIDDAFELTGLYDGIPMTQKSVSDQMALPDTIWLFRRPIIDEWAARGDVGLAELVHHVVIHEMAHHFGWSDDDIAAIDRWWE
ncbi:MULTISPECIES: metallopeptidase family protein [Paracoccus]|uniref:metallopeptidase family protein n=1 Tax=Paracoccus TaxID=265 RepID=UPI0003B49BCF|nr:MULTISPECIES: metallopeptidase family protein [Paracoccus]